MHGRTPKWQWTLQCQRYPLCCLLQPLSSKFCSRTPTVFEVQTILTSARMTFKLIWTVQCHRHPHMCYYCPRVQYFISFPSTEICFRINGRCVRQIHQLTPKWPWMLKRQTYHWHIRSAITPLPPHTHTHTVPNISLIRPTTSHFRDTGHLETSAPNNPNWHWTLRGQRYPLLSHQSLKF